MKNTSQERYKKTKEESGRRKTLKKMKTLRKRLNGNNQPSSASTLKISSTKQLITKKLTLKNPDLKLIKS